MTNDQHYYYFFCMCQWWQFRHQISRWVLLSLSHFTMNPFISHSALKGTGRKTGQTSQRKTHAEHPSLPMPRPTSAPWPGGPSGAARILLPVEDSGWQGRGGKRQGLGTDQDMSEGRTLRWSNRYTACVRFPLACWRGHREVYDQIGNSALAT